MKIAGRIAFVTISSGYQPPPANVATHPLKALSTQWDADQQQHVEKLDILRARIDELAQLVTTFAEQHKKQAADLQAQLQQLDTQVGILTKQHAHISADYKTLAELLAQA